MSMVMAIIQARMGSTRLPGKVLQNAGNKTILEHVYHRTLQARRLNKVVVTMPTNKQDDVLATFCKNKMIPYLRGQEEDLLDQYYQVAKEYNANIIVRITADCPLIDPEIIDIAIKEFFERKCDYLSTGRLVTTFPDGLDTEVMTFATLERAWKESKLPSEREHVTPYIWKHPDLFRIETIVNDCDLSSLRWTVDEPRDLEFIRAVFNEFNTNIFYMRDVLKLLSRKPELCNINSDIERNAGYAVSLRKERSN